MMAHLLPCTLCACAVPGVGTRESTGRTAEGRTSKIFASSSAEKGSFFTDGFSWLHHRRRQDLPLRPRMPFAMTDQFRAPCREMSLHKRSSSCHRDGSSEEGAQEKSMSGAVDGPLQTRRLGRELGERSECAF